MTLFAAALLVLAVATLGVAVWFMWDARLSSARAVTLLDEALDHHRVATELREEARRILTDARRILGEIGPER